MTEPGTPTVVFACVRNGGRSVAARLLTEHYARGRVKALSAGTQPGEHVHPEVAEVLERLGLDTSREEPKLLTREMIADCDLAITLGCGEECPYVPGVIYRDWPVDDPGGQDERTVRRIVAYLDSRVRDLVRGLVPGLDLPPYRWARPGAARASRLQASRLEQPVHMVAQGRKSSRSGSMASPQPVQVP